MSGYFYMQIIVTKFKLPLAEKEILLAGIKWEDTGVVYRIKKCGKQRHEAMLIGGHLCLLWCTHLPPITFHPQPLCGLFTTDWFLSNSSLHVTGTIPANSSKHILSASRPSRKRSSHLMPSSALVFLGSPAHSWNGLPWFTRSLAYDIRAGHCDQ